MVVNFPKADELVESSRKYAQSALKIYGTDQHERFPFYSVTAIEHLAKACLLKKNPVLLVELKDSLINEASLLALAGVKPFDSKRLRTIGVERALATILQVNEDEASIGTRGRTAAADGGHRAHNIGIGVDDVGHLFLVADHLVE